MNIFNMKKSLDRTNYFLKIFLIVFSSMIFVEELFKFLIFKNLVGLEQIRIIVFSLNTSLIVSFTLCLFKDKISKVLMFIFIFFDALYAFVESTFKGMFGNFMSLSNSSGGGLTRVLPEIQQFLSSIKIEYILFFIPFVVYLILILTKKINLKYEKQTRIRVLLYGLIVLLSCLLSYLSITLSFLQDKNQIKSNKELYNNPVMIDLSMKQFGAFRFFLRDFVNIFVDNDSYELTTTVKEKEEEIKEPDYTREIDDTKFLELIEKEENENIKELHNYFINKDITNKNEYTGYFKDKNLVLFMVEAFDMIAISEELTPTLYKLSKEGMYFSNYYTPKYSCTTGESEFIGETSIIPSSTVCTPNFYIDNNYKTSIFNIFKNNKYYVSSYHSWTDEFYTRTKLHINMGSELYQDYNDLKMSPINGWPLDSEMITNSYSNYIQKDKFFTFYITSSTHFPYDVDTTVTMKHWNKVKNTNYPIVVKRYLAKAIELDESLRILMEKLENDGKLDDTVIVLFGDHHPLKMNQSYLNEYSTIDRFENFNMDRLPFIIYNSNMKPEEVTKTASTFDILPTLANLFDLEYDPRFYMGVDVFSDEESIVIFTNGSWITDKCLYDSNTNTYKSLTEEEVTDEYKREINKKVNDKFYVSNKVLTLDYFKYLK